MISLTKMCIIAHEWFRYLKEMVHAISYFCNGKSASFIDCSIYYYCRHSTSGKLRLYLLKGCTVVLNHCLVSTHSVCERLL